MSEDFRQAPHPLLKEAVLYFPEPPKNVPWTTIIQAFSCCGTVLSAGKHNAPESQAWVVRFREVFEAEMALATLQGTLIPGTEPPIALALSATPCLASAAPENPLLPQFVQADRAQHPLRDASPQDVFRWFRSAGPLVYVHTNVTHVGFGQRTCVLEYWEEKHAQHARMHCRTLDPVLNGMPAFSLRTFDPTNIYCGKLGSLFQHAEFYNHFSKFGDISGVRLFNAGRADAFGFVSFTTREAARQAMIEMKGKIISDTALQIRYYEPRAQLQGNFRIPPKARVGPQAQKQGEAKDSEQANKDKVEARRHEDEERRRVEAERLEQEREDARRKEEEELRKKAEEQARRQQEREEQRKTEEEARRKEAEERRKRREEEDRRREREAEDAKRRARELQERRDAAERKRIDAVSAHRSAQTNVETVHQEHREAADRYAAAAQKAEEASAELAIAYKAVEVAERLLADAQRRQAEAARRAGDAGVERVNAHINEQEASVRVQAALQDEAEARKAREAAEWEEQAVLEETAEMDAEARRQEELAESIRKMQELKELEEADRREREQRAREREAERLRKIAEERLARAERERQAREEAERLEREKKEREEQEARRLRDYEHAAMKERERCRQRDFNGWNLHKFTLWTEERSIDRFRVVSTEFDEMRFSESQPLTFESVPWPVLQSPYQLSLEDIEWSAVEDFFRAAKLAVGDSEYKTMVEKAHRRFHPDKWRSRGLMKTILDEALRKKMEEAGNIVAQAITPLWLASKSR